MTGHDRETSSSRQSTEVPRRSVMTGFLAGLCASLAGLIPTGAGIAVLLDPILRRRSSEGGEEAAGKLLRVASIDSIPADGTPVQVPVLSDLADAWIREPNQPIGAIYLRREGAEVKCFNAICPHAGCFVAYSAERRVFQCPCHTSSFELDGKRIGESPSPRDMDPLTIDEQKLRDGEIWVRFQNYYPGKEEREAKP